MLTMRAGKAIMVVEDRTSMPRGGAMPKKLNQDEAIEDLRANGLLFQINTMLHAFGRSLQVVQTDEGGYEWGMLVDEDIPKMVLDPASYKAGLSKFAKFKEESGYAILEKRQKLLGFKVQARAEPAEQKRLSTGK